MALGKKTGGRQKGTKNKRTLAREQDLKKNRRGLTPLEYMLQVMRDKDADGGRRDDMAKAAAPYMHPRLNAIQHTGKDGEPIKVQLTGIDAGAL